MAESKIESQEIWTRMTLRMEEVMIILIMNKIIC